jgi:hypothetical protein
LDLGLVKDGIYKKSWVYDRKCFRYL